MLRLLPLLIFSLLQSPGMAGDKVVFLYGESEYGSQESLPELASLLEERLGLECVLAPCRGQNLPDLSVLDDADQLVMALRFRVAEGPGYERLQAWLALSTEGMLSEA